MKRILLSTLLAGAAIFAGYSLSGLAGAPEAATRAEAASCCELSQTEISLNNTDFIFHSVSVKAAEDMTVDVSGADWLQFAGLTESIAAGSQVSVDFAANGPTVVSRTAEILFKGKTSGNVTKLTVTQQPVNAGNAFPVKWNYDKTAANASNWTTTHYNQPNADIGSDNAYITAVGANNRKLTYSVTKSSIAVSGLYTGDYILYSVPCGEMKAGTDIDFFGCIDAASDQAPKYWVCEILDGGEWKLPKENDRYRNEDGDTYTFYTKYFSSYQYAYPNHTFTLSNDVKDGMVRVRCRVVGNRNGKDETLSETNTGAIFLPRFYCSMAAYPGVARKDVKKVGILGNSFTLYGIPYYLKEVARSQGHELDIRLHSKGSQTFENHLSLERSQKVFEENGYDYVLLQEQSTEYSDYAQNPTESTVTNCRNLAAKFRAGSPDARIILEHTWPFPNKTWYNFGTIDKFEENLHKGTLAVADAVDDINEVSLIGCAFTKAYKLGLTKLWDSDDKHPGPRGVYLKACVNYLTIFGEAFDANAADCGLNPVEADFLRKVAEETVLGTTPVYSELPKEDVSDGNKVAVLFADMPMSDTDFTATDIVKFPDGSKTTSINGNIFNVSVAKDEETTKVCSFMFMGEDTGQSVFSFIWKKSDGATRPLLNWSEKTSMLFNIPNDITVTKIRMQCTSAKNYTGTLTCSEGEVSTSDKYHTWTGNATGVLTFKHPNDKTVRLQGIEIEYEKNAAATSTGTALYENWDTYSDTWVAVDELGRKVATAGDGAVALQGDSEVSIGMFYYIWHGYHDTFSRSVTELLDENPSNPQWGADKQFHWIGKPWLGYYKGGDRYVIARHMQMLTDAGVDFLFLDCTNAYWYPAHVLAVMNEIDRRSALGLKSPKLAFCLNTKTPRTLNAIYELFYKTGDNDRFWYYYDGKPLMLANPDAADTNDTKVSDEARNYFTFRHSWAWMGGDNPGCWSWLENYPQQPGWVMDGDNKKIEQITVGVAQHAHSKIGKSYHNGAEPAYDEKGICKETPYGLYFQEQWDRAMEVKAPVVMVTQFNEWMAQRFVIDETTPLSYARPGGKEEVGETYFIDAYNAEFNRDIEPSTHPSIRDNYYLQLVSNIRKYRGASKIPAPTVDLTIDINGPFGQWDTETLEFRDDPNDSEYTSVGVQTSATLKRPTNDIVLSKVTQDDGNLYFYVQTVDDFYPFEESDFWMRLLLNTDCDYSTGWGGYDYCVYKDPDTGLYSLMKNDGGFTWKTVAAVEYREEGNEMHLRIPRAMLGLTAKSDIDFKWADNISDAPDVDIMSFISDGDVAPNGRFNYRYRGSADKSGIEEMTAGNSGQVSLRVNGDEVVIFNSGTENREVEIYNTLGQMSVRRVVAAGGSKTATLAPGVYIMHVAQQPAHKFIIR